MDEYWVFVCSPKRWAIDRFLEQRIEKDCWGIYKHHASRFEPGQLALVRVGVDRRSAANRHDALTGRTRPKLEPGIYALCEIISSSYAGTGATDPFWAAGELPRPGRLTVNIRYIRNYLTTPLTIDRLKLLRPGSSDFLLNPPQRSSFSISRQEFREIVELLGEDPDDLSVGLDPADTEAAVSNIESECYNAVPEYKESWSRRIERGKQGGLIKVANNFRCQLCEAMGQNPFGFRKLNGEPYIESHHVIPVSKLLAGSLDYSNLITVCANHHREIHYGEQIQIKAAGSKFEVRLLERTLTIDRRPHGSSARSLREGDHEVMNV